jgi:hypothetical protein
VTVVAVASVTGAPGVTRLALGLATTWPMAAHRRVLVEADPDGGRLGAELGVGVEPGLMALALACRTAALNADDVVGIGAAAIGSWSLVPAPSSAEQAYSALVHGAPALAAVMAGDAAELRAGRPPTDWIVDAGRLDGHSPALALAKAAGHVLLVTHGSFPELQLVPHRVDALRAAGCHVEVVVVEPTHWSPAEIAEFVRAEVVSVIPHVGSRRRGVRAMRANAWRPWWAAVDELATYLAGGVQALLDDDADDDDAEAPIEEAVG